MGSFPQAAVEGVVAFRRTKGGRRPYDAVLMFKGSVLQALYNLSDEQAEFQIQDCLSFMRFLGLSIAQKVRDAKTIWIFVSVTSEARCVEGFQRRHWPPDLTGNSGGWT